MRRIVLLFSLLCSMPAMAADEALLRQHAPETYLARQVHQAVGVFTVGTGAERAYVFLPQQPTPRGAPLVLFHHGWLGMNPKNFGALIDHLVRRGAVVIYPVYQDGARTPPQAITAQAARADAAALRELQRRYPGLVDPDRTLYFGFSMGASIALNLAIDPVHHGVPAPRALLLAAPGDAHHVARGQLAATIIDPLERLSSHVPVVLVSGQSDRQIGVPTARQIASRLCHLPAERRALLWLPGDSEHGVRIRAGHGSPGAPDSRYDFPDSHAAVPGQIPARAVFEESASLNNLDFYGYWRLTTRLLDWVAGGEYPSELFRDSAENRYLGRWPSGRAYVPARFEDPCPARRASR